MELSTEEKINLLSEYYQCKNNKEKFKLLIKEENCESLSENCRWEGCSTKDIIDIYLNDLSLASKDNLKVDFNLDEVRAKNYSDFSSYRIGFRSNFKMFKQKSVTFELNLFNNELRIVPYTKVLFDKSSLSELDKELIEVLTRLIEAIKLKRRLSNNPNPVKFNDLEITNTEVIEIFEMLETSNIHQPYTGRVNYVVTLLWKFIAENTEIYERKLREYKTQAEAVHMLGLIDLESVFLEIIDEVTSNVNKAREKQDLSEVEITPKFGEFLECLEVHKLLSEQAYELNSQYLGLIN